MPQGCIWAAELHGYHGSPKTYFLCYWNNLTKPRRHFPSCNDALWKHTMRKVGAQLEEQKYCSWPGRNVSGNMCVRERRSSRSRGKKRSILITKDVTDCTKTGQVLKNVFVTSVAACALISLTWMAWQEKAWMLIKPLCQWVPGEQNCSSNRRITVNSQHILPAGCPSPLPASRQTVGAKVPKTRGEKALSSHLL